MKVFIYGKRFTETQFASVQLLFNLLERDNAEVFVFQPYLEEIKSQIEIRSQVHSIVDFQDLKNRDIDYAFTLGGDGTILSAVTLIQDTGIPIMGINLGRLGFLASIEEKLIDQALQMLKSKRYRLEERSMLFLESSRPIFGEHLYALNDFTILKRDNSSMIVIHAYVNGEFLNSYWADGLIVSTPTGSTGYSLSCGGPIVFPRSKDFIITPVAPHNLNVRPLVISDDSVISFEVEGRTENFLCTLDSRFEIITQDFKLAVRKCDFGINLVQLEEMSFMKTMRNKLMWGIDTRKHF
ncbi:MAG: NAD kinase [Saprospiraceae bacterium]|nr:NAD kinase [Saprospiraceae bacterium]